MRVILSGAMLLTGCVTASDMRARAPDFEQTSPKAASEIAGCLGTNYVAKTSMQFASVPTDKGYAFTSGFDGAANILVDVIDEGQERRTRVYFRKFPVSFIPEGDHVTLIRGCL